MACVMIYSITDFQKFGELTAKDAKEEGYKSKVKPGRLAAGKPGRNTLAFRRNPAQERGAKGKTGGGSEPPRTPSGAEIEPQRNRLRLRLRLRGGDEAEAERRI